MPGLYASQWDPAAVTVSKFALALYSSLLCLGGHSTRPLLLLLPCEAVG